MNFEIVGYIAACCTSLSFIPQVLKILKTKDTTSISLEMYTIFVSGVALWFFYGVSIEAWPVAIANAVTLTLAGTILALKIKDVTSKK